MARPSSPSSESENGSQRKPIRGGHRGRNLGRPNSSGRPASRPHEGTFRVTFRGFFGQLAPLECSHRHKLPGCDRTSETGQPLAFLGFPQALFCAFQVALVSRLSGCPQARSQKRARGGGVPSTLFRLRPTPNSDMVTKRPQWRLDPQPRSTRPPPLATRCRLMRDEILPRDVPKHRP